MRVLTLDLSLTAIGWACNPGWQCGVFAPKGRGVHRLQHVLEWLGPVARGERGPKVGGEPGERPDLVLIEGYSFNSEFSHAHALGELGGVVRLVLHQLRVPAIDVPPACLKKFATGKGNARKDAVLAEAIRRLGYDGSDHNAADARWLLAMALVQYGLPNAPDLPKEHRAGLAKVEWLAPERLRRIA